MDRLNSVQGLRAIAAWLVVVSHGAQWAAGFGPLGISMRSFELLGGLGVLMFFTMSGFIMLHISRRSFGEPGAPARFLRRRIVRIVPLYWGMTLLAAAMGAKDGTPPGVVHLVTSLLFIPYLADEPFIRPVLGVGWTLNYEMFFYIAFAGSLFLRNGLAILVITLTVLLIIGQVLNPVWDFHDPRNPLEVWTAPMLLPFLLGIGCAMLRDARPKTRTRHPFLLVGLGCLASVVVQDVVLPPESYPALWRVGVILLGALFGAAAILASEGVKTPAWLTFTGDASYSLYLIHPMLFGVTRRLGGETLATWNPHLAIAFYVALTTVAAFTLFLFVEQPVTRYLSQRAKMLERNDRRLGSKAAGP